MESLDMKKVAIGAGVVAAIAVLLPWYSASVSGMGQSASGSANGFNTEVCSVYGIFAMLAAIGGIVMLVIDHAQAPKFAPAVFGFGALMALIFILSGSSGSSQSMMGMKASAGADWGVWVCVLASAVAAGASWKAGQTTGGAAE